MDWEFRSDQPIYTQLIQHMRAAIVSGIFEPGERLPSVRDMAMEAGVNPNTMQRALVDLEREELVFSQRTAGRFVTEDKERIRKEKLFLAKEQVDVFLTNMNKIGCTKEDIIRLLQQQVVKGTGSLTTTPSEQRHD